MHTCFFLVLRVGYVTLDVGLFNGPALVAMITQDKKEASCFLIPVIRDLLNKASLSLANIAFIGACHGPGPFASLRIGIVTANGLGFATGTPLVAIDSFEALLRQEYDVAWPSTLALYNAYNQDFYYALQAPDRTIIVGCGKKEMIAEVIAEHFSLTSPFRCIGQGVSLIAEFLRERYGDRLFIPSSLPHEPGVGALGACAYESFLRGKTSLQLNPLYLKYGYNL